MTAASSELVTIEEFHFCDPCSRRQIDHRELKESLKFPSPGSRGKRSIYANFNKILREVVAEEGSSNLAIADWNSFSWGQAGGSKMMDSPENRGSRGSRMVYLKCSGECFG